jgi:hypothetical protein
MNFKQAFEAMKQGAAVKLPSWKGYWKCEDGSIKMHCKDDRILDIRESEDMLYTLTGINSDEWEVIDTLPADIDLNVQTFTFGEAIRNLKSGYKVARKGWNGKGMWLILCEFDNDAMIFIEFDDPIQYKKLPWIGIKTADNGFVPWLASQTDMLAEDWQIV